MFHFQMASCDATIPTGEMKRLSAQALFAQFILAWKRNGNLKVMFLAGESSPSDPN